MIIYVGEINLQIVMQFEDFVDHLIDILKIACRKKLLQRWKFSTEYISPHINQSKYNVLNII